MDLIISEPISGCIYHFYIAHHLLAPPTILKHFFGHCRTLPRLKGPSWTFMDPQMDPKTDPARLISGVIGKKGSMVRIGHFFVDNRQNRFSVHFPPVRFSALPPWAPCCDMFYCDRDLKKVFFNSPRTGRKIYCKYTELH